MVLLTRLKNSNPLKAGVKTREPSTRAKHHDLTDRKTQTDSVVRRKSFEGDGPSFKRKRLENVFLGYACFYTSVTSEHEE